jgi:hypothetical protein
MEKLRFTRIDVRGQVIQPPSIPQVLLPGQVPQVPQVLAAQVIARIYGEVAKYGFASLQEVPGGALIGSADGFTTLLLTASFFHFGEDISKSSFGPSVEKLGITMEVFFRQLAPGTAVVGHVVDLQAVWDDLGEQADALIERRFLKPAASKLVAEIGLAYNGGAIRLSLARPVTGGLPAGFMVLGPAAQESIDIRIEPLFADKSKLFLHFTGSFAPTTDPKELARRAKFVHDLAWDRLARNLTVEA